MLRQIKGNAEQPDSNQTKDAEPRASWGPVSRRLASLSCGKSTVLLETELQRFGSALIAANFALTVVPRALGFLNVGLCRAGPAAPEASLLESELFRLKLESEHPPTLF